MQEGLSALPEEYRKVLILREIEGLSLSLIHIYLLLEQDDGVFQGVQLQRFLPVQPA